MSWTNPTEFERHRGWLLNLAYRMLGSFAEAEDLVQETWLRWHAATDEVREPRAWLTRVLTRLCLDALRSARRQRETYVGDWLPEPVRTDRPETAGYALELADSLSTAMLVLLERLNPNERAAWLLREIFDYDYIEVARVLDLKETHCRQLVSRARRHLGRPQARFLADPVSSTALLQRFVEAIETGQTEQLERLLTKDSVLVSDGGGKAIAALRPIEGADRIIRFFQGIRRKAQTTTSWENAELNGAPALLARQGGKVVTAFTFTITESGQLSQIYAIRNPDKLKYVQK